MEITSSSGLGREHQDRPLSGGSRRPRTWRVEPAEDLPVEGPGSPYSRQQWTQCEARIGGGELQDGLPLRSASHDHRPLPEFRGPATVSTSQGLDPGELPVRPEGPSQAVGPECRFAGGGRHRDETRPSTAGRHRRFASPCDEGDLPGVRMVATPMVMIFFSLPGHVLLSRRSRGRLPSGVHPVQGVRRVGYGRRTPGSFDKPMLPASDRSQ